MKAAVLMPCLIQLFQDEEAFAAFAGSVSCLAFCIVVGLLGGLVWYAFSKK